MSLLHHQEEDEAPQDCGKPGTGHGALYTEVVSEGDVLKVPDVREILVVLPVAVVLGVEIIVTVVLLQLVVIGRVGQKTAAGDGSLKPILTEGVEVATGVSVDFLIAGENLVDLLLLLAGVLVLVGLKSVSDLLLHPEIQVTTGESVASADDAGDCQDHSANTAVHHDLTGERFGSVS